MGTSSSAQRRSRTDLVVIYKCISGRSWLCPLAKLGLWNNVAQTEITQLPGQKKKRFCIRKSWPLDQLGKVHRYLSVLIQFNSTGTVSAHTMVLASLQASQPPARAAVGTHRSAGRYSGVPVTTSKLCMFFFFFFLCGVWCSHWPQGQVLACVHCFQTAACIIS